MRVLAESDRIELIRAVDDVLAWFVLAGVTQACAPETEVLWIEQRRPDGETRRISLTVAHVARLTRAIDRLRSRLP